MITSTIKKDTSTVMSDVGAILHGNCNEYSINRRWPNLRIEGGVARIGAVLGWLWGLNAAGGIHAEFAEMAAKDFFGQLDMLNTYGGLTTYSTTWGDGTPREVEVPAYLVRLVDDGTFNGFGVAWFRHATKEDFEAYKTACEMNNARVHYIKGNDGETYRYSHNGGLLYHGPGGGQTFAVTLDTRRDRFWSIHT